MLQEEKVWSEVGQRQTTKAQHIVSWGTESCVAPFSSQRTEKKAVDCFEQVSVATLQAFGQGFSSRKPSQATPSAQDKGCPAFLSCSCGALVRTRNPEFSQDLWLPLLDPHSI